MQIRREASGSSKVWTQADCHNGVTAIANWSSLADGQRLKRSKSFTYLGMLFHEDGKIRHAASPLQQGLRLCGVHLFPIFSAAMCELGTATSQVAAGHLAALCLVRL